MSGDSLRLGVVFLSFALIAGCVSTAQQSKLDKPWENWAMVPAAPSGLQGKIWSYQDQRFITPKALAKAMAKADFALLGETHDNADHHRLQGWVVSAIAARGRRPAVVWEMFDTDQSDALANYQATAPKNADGLGVAVKWAKTGWPKWPLYQPIAEAALAANLTMFAGDPPVKLVRAVGKKGYSILPAGQVPALLLDQPLGGGLKQALQQQIVTSHCNLIPPEATGPMYNGQRLRDAYMASSMTEHGKSGGAILIAGTGHVRTDRAVPWYLRRHNPSASIASLMFVGVTAEDKDPQTLVPMGPDGKPAADYAWFTPKVEREDPCISLKKRFAK
jgi:uncharacterized iron-regulated protein